MTTTWLAATLEAPATEPQMNMLRKIAAKKTTEANKEIIEAELVNVKKCEVDALKNWLFSLPWPSKIAAPVEKLKDGVYVKDERVFKLTTAGSGKQWAKILVPYTTSDGKSKARYEFCGAPVGFTADMLMTLAQGKTYSLKISACCVCGRTLTAKQSVEEGIGPICSGRLA